MKPLQKACCCFTLRTGNLILGWYNLITGVIAIGVLVSPIFQVDDIQYRFKYLPKNLTKQDLKIITGVFLALSCISPIIAIFHLYGSYKYRKEFLLPYLVGGGIQLGILAIAIIYYFVMLQAQFIMTLMIIYFIFMYLYFIPLSFYKEMRDERSPGMPHA